MASSNDEVDEVEGRRVYTNSRWVAKSPPQETPSTNVLYLYLTT